MSSQSSARLLGLSCGQHVLGITEICREVCLTVKDSGRETWRRDLMAAACCCRAMSETPIEILWEDMISPVPLLALLPNLSMNSSGVYEIVRPFKTEDWIRFDAYTRHVRTLRYEHPHSGNCTIYQKIFNQKSSPLFPFLRSIQWLHSSPRSFIACPIIMEIIPFLTLSMDHIVVGDLHRYIHGPPDSQGDSKFYSLLNTLPTLCPSLKSLHLSGPMSTTSLFFVVGFTQLGSLSIDNGHCVNTLTLSALASLKFLHTLSVVNFSSPALQTSIMPVQSFPSLKTLDIVRGSAPHLLLLLTSVSSRSFGRCHVEEVGGGSIDDMVLLMKQLARFHLSLVELRWKSTGAERELGADVDFATELLQPLFTLGRLEWLELDLGLTYSNVPTFPGVFGLKMGQSWPKIRQLTIQSSMFQFSMESLAEFISQCPDVVSICLNLSVETDAGSASHMDIALITPRTSLVEIRAPIDGCRDAYRLAGILHHLFPNLKKWALSNDVNNELVNIIMGRPAGTRSARSKQV
ncbi:hypothetical protein JAAARDRAFT_421395 [Jaapia argillacea MUCL 33604]|uniref:F-box domain-containing protein n=1 Tax=Jaapia argillacea MUCL 33604 TaxID=933084 RepID=A0A067PFM8_9AGAM|nr:hypothetical protein JAAARDRAFT_421395 [Jaapia argillacea MUCL 33604]